jgi:enediyne biosynthesis protein E4
LLRNKGDGTFENVTAPTGYHAAPTGDPCALLWTDYDNDGDQDLQIWNDEGNPTQNRVLLRNDGQSHFTDVAVAAGLVDSIGHPMGIDGADIDRNGFIDYYIGNIAGNPLYLANGDGTFRNIMTEAYVNGSFGWGLGFEDFNLDSWPDIFIAQEDDKRDMTFTHHMAVPPKFIGAYWYPAPLLYTGWAHNVAVAFADYDKNGMVDIVRATTDGSRVTLFRNTTPVGSNGWLEVRIGRTPGTGEKGGVSARVVVKTGDLVQFRDINGGSSRGSNNATSARFGLGRWTGADWVAAIWPDGRELSALNVPGNREIVLDAPP